MDCSESNWRLLGLPTPFASFPFTSPPVLRRVPPDSVSTLPTMDTLSPFPYAYKRDVVTTGECKPRISSVVCLVRISKFMHDTILEYSNILYVIVISIMAYLVQNFCLFFSITDSTKCTVTKLFCHDFKASPSATNNLPNSCLSQPYCQHEQCRIQNPRRLICDYFIPPCSVSDVNGAVE